MVDKKRNDTHIIGSVILGCMFMLFLLFLLTTKAEVEIIGSCNTGKVGIDFTSEYENQEYPCNSIDKNLSCYHSNMLPNKLDLKDIENLECKEKVKVNGPFLFLITMMGGD